jgi:outer membrane protein assembly factor BamA
VGYNYTISNRTRDQRAGYVVASIGLDEGGDLINAVSRAFGPRGRDPELLFGKRYAQYARVRPEFRYYGPANTNGDRFVARLIAGAVKPFGNSEVAPFVKQFFIGGTNSVRAFRARSVGPGTYAPEENNGLLIDQAGDIRIELNAEYRFTFHGYFKGAFFADAGNVWLFNEDPQRPGGRFDLSRMLDEMAVGSGFGLRFDPEVIVVRLDLATPVRIPSLPVGDRWAFDHFKPALFDNIVLNIAVGYPF